MAAILKNLNCYISATVEAIVMKFCMLLSSTTSHSAESWKFEF